MTRSSAVERRGDRAVDVAQVVRLGRRQEDADLVEAVAQLERVIEAARVRDEHAARDAVAGRRSPSSTSRASASCGMTSARTKLVTSMRRSPVRARRSMSATLSAVAIDLGLVLEAVARADLADLRPGRRPASRAAVDDLGAQPAGDDHLLDLVGPLADREDLRVAVHAADRVLLDVAVAAVDLHGLVGAAHRQAAGLELRLRGGEAERPARRPSAARRGRRAAARPRSRSTCRRA